MHSNRSVLNFPRVAPVLMAVALLGAAACNPDGDGVSGDATVSGRVSDDDGSQFSRLGGVGTIESSSTVSAYTMSSDGTLHEIGTGSVDADGHFEFDVPSGEESVIVRSMNADGDVVASAILESTGEAGDTVTCTPLDTESSIEAEVLIAMVADSGSVAATNPVDLRMRIDADTAVAVRAVYEDDGEAQAMAAIDALGRATLAAQATQLEAWSEEGYDTTQQSTFHAQMAASQQLSAALYAETSNTAAWTTFTAALDASWDDVGELSIAERAESEAQAGLAFRLVLNGRLEGTEVASDATQAAATLEAAAEARGVAAIFAGADAGSEVQIASAAAGDSLVADVHGAASTAALVASWTDFETSLIGSTTIQGSALGQYLGADVTTAVVMDAAIVSSTASAATLETAVTTSVNLLVTGVGAIDSQAVAAAVVDGWATHRAQVEAAIAGASPTIATEDAQVAADITVLATGGFRASE